jgi:uncharacterized membrane protein YccC
MAFDPNVKPQFILPFRLIRMVNILSKFVDTDELVGSVAFVIRCAFAAVAAYKLAALTGLSMPVWASISALVVSQERWHETRSSLYDRIRGTLLGVAISLTVNLLAIPLGTSSTVQLIVAVAICAAITRVDRGLRTCMWTCPIVLLSAHMGSEPVIATGLYRALEITIGCAVGAACHFVAERLLDAYESRRT